MVDNVAAAEQRCLRLVALAEQQARESQRDLQRQVASLQQQLADRDELYVTQLEQSEASLRLYMQHLQDISNRFFVAHREATQSLLTAVESREQIETSMTANWKEILNHFHKYVLFERNRAFRHLFLRVIGRYTHLAQSTFHSLRDSSVADLRTLAVGSHHNLEMSKLDEENRVGFVPMSFEEYMEVRGGADTSSPLELSEHSELPMEELISNPLYRSSAVLGNAARDGVDVAPVMRAVALYLCGSVDVLDRLGDKVVDAINELARKIEEFHVGYLLRDERKLLQINASSLCSTLVEISPQVVANALLEKVVSAADERMLFLASSMRELQISLTDSLVSQVHLLYKKFVGLAAPLLCDGLYMSEAQFRDRLLNSVCESSDLESITSPKSGSGTTSGAVVPPVVVSSLYGLLSLSSSFGDKVLIRVNDAHHQTLRRVQIEMSTQLEAVHRASVAQRKIVVEQKVSEVRLDDLRSDISHHQTMRMMFLDREKQVHDRVQCEVKRLELEADHLRSTIAKVSKEAAVLREKVAMAEAEVLLLRELTGKREETVEALQRVKEETKLVNYTINYGTYGETWQESLLRLRERILRELNSDNARFLAKLRSFLKRKEVDQVQIEQLYETRLKCIVNQMQEEGERKNASVKHRYELEITALRDENARVIDRVRQEASVERERTQQFYEEQYLHRLQELNALYSGKVLKLKAREDDIEQRFATSIQKIRQSFRQRENDLEKRLMERYNELYRIFEADSNRLKEQYAERRRELEHAHLQAEANLESKVNERVQHIHKQFELLSSRLQEDVLRFVGEKQAFFDNYRGEELALFSDFVHKKVTIATENFRSMLVAQQQRNEQLLTDSQRDSDVVLQKLAAAHELDLSSVRTETDERLLRKAALHEQEAAVAAQLQREKEMLFWQQCQESLLHREQTVINQKSTLELETQQRYKALIGKCQEFLNKDMQVARESFERELRQRYAHLHASCAELHKVQLLEEHLLWEEVEQRAYIRRLYQVQLDFLKVTREEGRLAILKGDYSRALREKTSLLECFTIEDIRSLRDKYDARLVEEHSFVMQLARETAVSLEVGLEATHTFIQRLQDAHRTHLADLVRTFDSKIQAYEEQRASLVSTTLNRLIASCERPNSEEIQNSRRINVKEVSSQIAGVPMATLITNVSSQWESQLQRVILDSQSKNRDLFSGMHEEYVAATSSLLAKVEKLQMGQLALEAEKHLANALVDAQRDELVRAASMSSRGVVAAASQSEATDRLFAKECVTLREQLAATSLRV